MNYSHAGFVASSVLPKPRVQNIGSLAPLAVTTSSYGRRDMSLDDISKVQSRRVQSSRFRA